MTSAYTHTHTHTHTCMHTHTQIPIVPLQRPSLHLRDLEAKVQERRKFPEVLTCPLGTWKEKQKLKSLAQEEGRKESPTIPGDEGPGRRKILGEERWKLCQD